LFLENFLLGTTGALLFSGICYNKTQLQNRVAFTDEAGHLVFSWGSSKYGQLGLGHEKSSVTRVTSIPDLDSMTIK